MVLRALIFSDWDGDGLPNQWELDNGLNPNNSADAAQDSDEDGLTNLEEYQAGTKPNNRDSDGDQIPDGQDSEPLVFNNSGSCQSADTVISNKTYDSAANEVCMAANSIRTEGEVVISSGAHIEYHAPVITLMPGFKTFSNAYFSASTPQP